MKPPERFDPNARAVCHNHLNGSGHCVECGGPCALREPAGAALTSIVRSLIEHYETAGQPMPPALKWIFARHGIDADGMRRAAGLEARAARSAP